MTNREERQQKILLMAANLFWQKGYDRTTIEDIASASGMNKSMFYYYFPDKQSVLRDIIYSSMRTILTKARAISRLEVSPERKLELLIKNHLSKFAEEKAIPGTANTELRNLSPKYLRQYLANRDKYEAIFRSIISQGVEAGEFRRVDVNLATSLILGMLNSVIIWYRPDGRYRIEDIAERLIDLLALSTNTRALESD